MIPQFRLPSHPGEILLEEFLRPSGLTQTELAARMDVPIQRINELVKGKRGVTAATALLLSRVFETTPEFWMNLQTNSELAVAQQQSDAAP